jgi:hypothetical protein
MSLPELPKLQPQFPVDSSRDRSSDVRVRKVSRQVIVKKGHSVSITSGDDPSKELLCDSEIPRLWP